MKSAKNQGHFAGSRPGSHVHETGEANEVLRSLPTRCCVGQISPDFDDKSLKVGFLFFNVIDEELRNKNDDFL